MATKKEAREILAPPGGALIGKNAAVHSLAKFTRFVIFCFYNVYTEVRSC